MDYDLLKGRRVDSRIIEEGMIDKLTELLGSRRFWILLAGAASFVLGQWAAGTLTPEVVLNTFATLAAAVAGIGTLDKAWVNLK